MDSLSGVISDVVDGYESVVHQMQYAFVLVCFFLPDFHFSSRPCTCDPWGRGIRQAYLQPMMRLVIGELGSKHQYY